MKKRILLITMSILFAFSALACAKQPAPVATPADAVSMTLETAAAETAAPVTPAVEPMTTTADWLGLKILRTLDTDMADDYTLIAVNPDASFMDADGKAIKDVVINAPGTAALVYWLLGDDATMIITHFGEDTYGEALYHMNPVKQGFSGSIHPAENITKQIRLLTTTSLVESGLLDALLPVFEEKYGYAVEVISDEPDEILSQAKMGNADLILLDDKAKEEAFVKDGFAALVPDCDTERLVYFASDYVLAGPAADPAKSAEAGSIQDAFARIAEGKFPFVSRGDLSATHATEAALWPSSLGITTNPASVSTLGEWYFSGNANMSASLTMANEMDGYILADKASFLVFAASGGAVG